MKKLNELISAFHWATYSLPAQTIQIIQITAVLIIGILSLLLFTSQSSKTKRILVDAIFFVLASILAITTTNNIYSIGPQIFGDLLAYWVLFAVMGLSYYLPMRIMHKSSKPFIAFFIVLFAASSWTFTQVYVLVEIIPANVFINWG